MFAKLMLGAVLLGGLGVTGATAPRAGVPDCCAPGAACCYPGSPCCEAAPACCGGGADCCKPAAACCAK